MSNNSNNRPIILTAAGVLAAILAGGGGALWFNSRPEVATGPRGIETPAPSTAPLAEQRPSPTATAKLDANSGTPPQGSAQPPAGVSAGVGGPGEGTESIADQDAMILPEKAASPSVYWVGAKGNRVEFEPETIAIKPDASPSDGLKTAIDKLLAGKESTAIPVGTQLLSLKVDGDEVYIDLSDKFSEGGGTASMVARIGQVIYTTTTVQPNAKIWLSVEGKRLEMIGGEGLMVEQPLTEERFAKDFNL